MVYSYLLSHHAKVLSWLSNNQVAGSSKGSFPYTRIKSMAEEGLRDWWGEREVRIKDVEGDVGDRGCQGKVTELENTRWGGGGLKEG